MDREEKICKSVGDYLNIILESNKKLSNNDENLEKRKNGSDSTSNKYYYRGEAEKYSHRTPSLYLEENLTRKGSEYYYRVLLNELGREDYQESASLARLISELQHYGAKTRILDVTTNPLIALYFAVEKSDDEPGYIYTYSCKKGEEKFDTGHTVAIKSALSFMPQEIINKFLETMIKISASGYQITNEMTLEDLRNRRLYHSDYIDAISIFMEMLNQKARVREVLKYPFKIFNDLKRAHIILPAKSTERIRQQQGAFIYPAFVSTEGKGFEEIQKEISTSIEELSVDKLGNYQSNVIIVAPEDKNHIKNELKLLGITKGLVYPDINHLSDYLLES
jgi:hypothetical protein